jgi:hypothetical protein
LISEPEVAEQLDTWVVLGIATLPGIRQLLVAPVALAAEQNSDQSPHQVAVAVAVSKQMDWPIQMLQQPFAAEVAEPEVKIHSAALQ